MYVWIVGLIVLGDGERYRPAFIFQRLTNTWTGYASSLLCCEMAEMTKVGCGAYELGISGGMDFSGTKDRSSTIAEARDNSERQSDAGIRHKEFS